MDNETDSQTDRRKRNPHAVHSMAQAQHSTEQRDTGDRATSKATGAAVQSPDMLGQGQTLVCYTASVSGLGSRQRGPMAAGGAGGLASLQSTEQGKAACTCSRRGRGIAPPVQSAAGTALASQPGPSWVGMRPRRPLQDVREVREVGKGPAPGAGTWPWYLALVPARGSWQAWHRGTVGRKEPPPKEGRSSGLPQQARRDLLLPSETSAGKGRCRDQLQPRFKISLGPRRPILLVHAAPT